MKTEESTVQWLGLSCGAVMPTGVFHGAAAPSGDVSLVKNGNFTAEVEGRPTYWTIRDSGQRVSLDKREKPEGAQQSLRLDVVRDAGENYGEILQVVKVKPATLDRAQGEVRGTRTRHGYFGDGRVYVLNNTVLILPADEPQVRGGIGDGDRTLCNTITRNNIFQVPAAADGETCARSSKVGGHAAPGA